MHGLVGAVTGEVADASDWGAFQSGFLAPLVDYGVVWVVAWLVCIVGARLLSAWRGWTRSPVTRRYSMRAKWIGGLIAAVAAAGFVGAGALTSAVGPWLALAWAVVVVLAIVGVIVLAHGMATTPWLKITVIGPSGSSNDAWATEVTVRMRDLNADNPSGRVERPDGSDLNELVTIADRTENWAVALIGGAMSMLLNLTPWRLEVTIFDTESGVARLRRNGRIVEDAALELPAVPAVAEHPGELLVLAAAFAATNVARRYPDIIGFYNTREWLGLGLIGIARRTRDDELREQYIARAIQADPRSILVEFEDVYERYRGATDPLRLRELLDRLEPMIHVAAVLAGRRVEALHDARFRPWHALDREPKRDSDEARRRWRRITAHPEPQLLMMRLLTYYTMTVRNWLMSGDTAFASDAERLACTERAIAIVGEFVAALESMPLRERDAADEVFARMEQRAGLGLLLLLDDHDGLRGGEPDERLRDRRVTAERWKQAAMASTEVEVKYSVACYQSRRIAAGRANGDGELADVVERLTGVCWVEEYRDLAIIDPELIPLGREPAMRDAVLFDMLDAWQIDRFREARLQLESAGVRRPEELAAAGAQHRAVQRSGLGGAEVAALADAARILRAALEAEFGFGDGDGDGGVGDECDASERRSRRERWARLRAARCLLDDGRHSSRSLIAEYDDDAESIVDDVARAMFWVADDDERRAVGDYLDRLVELVRAASPSDSETAETADPATAARRRSARVPARAGAAVHR
ncbi:hypothetical protein [Agromyces italicus]|uniref:hypothetical protein n=1 Tax=Agromyces italicus TaxID=279572 RepID=UPI0003B2EEAB|nr:hypothetical protein [Agromyces italicus]